MVEAFNKILENTLTKECNEQRTEWDIHVSAMLGIQSDEYMVEA